MPPTDRHGKTAQDYRSALIAELFIVPAYRRHMPRRSSPIAIGLLKTSILLSLDWDRSKHGQTLFRCIKFIFRHTPKQISI